MSRERECGLLCGEEGVGKIWMGLVLAHLGQDHGCKDGHSVGSMGEA